MLSSILLTLLVIKNYTGRILTNLELTKYIILIKLHIL